MAFPNDFFTTLPIVGILRGFTTAQADQAAAAAAAGGIRCVEVTMDTPDAPGQIAHLRKQLRDRVTVGAGTVRTLAELERAAGAGAEFIVTPITVPAVIAACVERKLPVFPGAMTPTEIFAAWDLGATAVKIFPAEILGPRYLQAIAAPLTPVRLMPTGGVTPESLPEYRQAGASAFGVGGPLFNKQRIGQSDWGWITEQARRFAEAFNSCKR